MSEIVSEIVSDKKTLLLNELNSRRNYLIYPVDRIKAVQKHIPVFALYAKSYNLALNKIRKLYDKLLNIKLNFFNSYWWIFYVSYNVGKFDMYKSYMIDMANYNDTIYMMQLSRAGITVQKTCLFLSIKKQSNKYVMITQDVVHEIESKNVINMLPIPLTWEVDNSQTIDDTELNLDPSDQFI